MNDVQLTAKARERIREFVAAEVVQLIQSMALERGMSELPSIPGADAAEALTAVAGTLERSAAELMALAALAVPQWELAVTAEELARAVAARVRLDASRAAVFSAPFDGVRETRGLPGQG